MQVFFFFRKLAFYNKIEMWLVYRSSFQANETTIKTSLRARGPPGVSGALRSGRILRIGRIGSEHSNQYHAVNNFIFLIKNSINKI